MPRETKQTMCIHCGRAATRMNGAGQPACKEHKDRDPKEIGCPECGFNMHIKEGKYGYFWGCEGYPGCEKTLSIEQSLKMEKYREPDVDLHLDG
ncbi:MAG: topoisomerase DNA-binding C4 zinc finger domain-containing protein [Candidatus Nanohaloarchaea archaeon]|nr:topoisomerase DNA-binding C4 zinc finger domain-containing protein [Candidatus Nanohaloarchaea archaeon]